MVEVSEIFEVLRSVIDPDLQKDIVSLGFVKNVEVFNKHVKVTLELTTPACPVREQFKKQCEELILQLPGIDSVEVCLSSSANRREKVSNKLGLKEVDAVIAISACKGGVGKSTVAAYLARAMQRQGLRVALLDADIYGPSAPTLFSVRKPEVQIHDNFIYPVDVDGLAVMSIGFVLGESPAMLRGPIVSNYLIQLLYQTNWGKLDYLIVDLPPGTGDIQLTLVQQIFLDGAVIVTTPHSLSLVDVARGIVMFEKVNVPVLGVVENFCSFTCDNCGKVHYPFGRSGKMIQERFGLSTLAELPILSGLSDVSKRDAGASVPIFSELADRVHRAVGMSRALKQKKPEVFPSPDHVIIRWPDGVEKAFRNYDLRCACPCARCVDEYTGKKVLNPSEVPLDIWVEDVQFLGNYAVAFTWSDGHSTGIYSWDYLRELAPSQ